MQKAETNSLQAKIQLPMEQSGKKFGNVFLSSLVWLYFVFMTIWKMFSPPFLNVFVEKWNTASFLFSFHSLVETGRLGQLTIGTSSWRKQCTAPKYGWSLDYPKLKFHLCVLVWGLLHSSCVLSWEFLYVFSTCVRARFRAQWLHLHQMTGDRPWSMEETK